MNEIFAAISLPITLSMVSFSGMLFTMDCAIFLGTAGSPLAFKTWKERWNIPINEAKPY